MTSRILRGLGMVLLAFLFLVGLGYILHERSADSARERLLALARKPPLQTDLGWLPPAAQLYFHLMLPHKVALPNVAVVEQQGRLRLTDEGHWENFTASQMITANPGLVWSGRIQLGSLIWIGALDTLVGQKGRFRGRLFWLVPVADDEGPQVATSNLVHYLGQAVWLPSALLPRPGLTWLPGPDRHSARVELKVGPHRVGGLYRFDKHGRVLSFESSDRWRQKGGKLSRQLWRITYHKWRRLAGVGLPTEYRMSWVPSPNKAYLYGEVSLLDVQFQTRGKP